MAQFLLSGFADEASGDLQGQIAALKRNNMEYLEIRNIDGKCVLDYSIEEIKDFAKQLKDAGIKVNSLGSPIGKYNITDEFEPHFERFKKACEVAKILETKNMRMFSFFIPDGEEAMNYKDEVLKRMRAMLDYAKEQGIQLCHENEARIFGRLNKECVFLQEQLPDLKAVFDSSNYIMEDEEITPNIDRIAKYVEYIHVKDNSLSDHIIVPAGYGDGKYDEVIEKVAVQRGDKDTFITLEPHLFKFIGYSNLDHREMKHKFEFENSNQSFDAAVNALKDILRKLGYKEGADKKWKK